MAYLESKIKYNNGLTISLYLRRQTLIFIKDMLKEIIKSKGIKQKYLASRIGVSEVTVSHWMKGKSSPSKKHLDKLSEILEVPVKEIVN